MSNSSNDPPTTADQDAAALLMLFQSQSASVVPQPQIPQQQPPQQPPLLPSSSGPLVSEQRDTATVPPKAQLLLPAQISSHSSVATIKEGSDPQLETVPSTEVKASPKLEHPLSHSSIITNTETSIPISQENTHQLILVKRPNLSAKSSGSTSNHSRSSSGNNFNTSPGPAAAALAVDNKKTDSKKNPNNRKAMVAAALLAAAAATPFPLLSHEPQRLPEPRARIEVVKVEAPLVEPVIEPVHETKPLEDIKDLIQEEDKKEESVEKEDVEMEDENEEKPTVDEVTPTAEESSYFVDPDSGTIGCICEYDHDDGFTIQCDRCYRWQHASCMGIKSMDEAPEFYLCYLCDKTRKVDKDKAREIQRDFLMPTSKRKRLHSMETEASRKEIVEQVLASKDENTNDEEKRRKSSTSIKDKEVPTSNSGKNRKGKVIPLKKEYTDSVDDTELFASSKDAYKTAYFPLTECEYHDENTKNLLKRFADLISNNASPFSAVTEFSDLGLQKKLSESKIIVKLFGESAKVKFSGFSRFAVNIESNVLEGDYILEVVGEIQLKQDYIDNPFNHYNIWGVAKPKVFFIPETPFVVDARYSGNEGRFLRRSCTPSCELKVVILNDSKSVHFAVVLLRPLKAGQELTIPWDWDASHPIHKIINGKTFDQLTDQEKPVLIRSVETVLNSCECACSNNNECYLYKVRKLLAYLSRSTRKVNMPTFGNNMTKYADIYRQRDESYYIPIKDRLEQRHRRIIAESSRDPNSSDDGLKSHVNGDLPQKNISSDERRDFILKKRHNISDLADTLLPYKYKISKMDRTYEKPKNHETHTLKENVKIEPSLIESYLIPIPIIKQPVASRTLSISTTANSTIVNTQISDSLGVNGAKPPIKKKMSLKDYMKSKKK